MSNETKARLRDRRLPQHFWADNEIIDVFGDELGQNGISVYMTMTRYCYGTEVRMSLRDIGAAARMNKDSVRRAMKVLVGLGLVIEARGPKVKTVSTWSLADVKALAKEYIRESAARTVSGEDRWIAAKTQESVSSARQSTLVEILKEQGGICLPVRQSVSEVENQNNPVDFSIDKKICVAQDATDLSQKEVGFETDLSQSEGGHLYSKTQDTRLQDNNPLPPSNSKGDAARMATEPSAENGAKHCDEAVRKVMRELDISNPRMERVIARAISAFRAKTDDPPDCNAVAENMIARRKGYLEWEDMLKYQVGIRKFIQDGVWADDRQWVLDKDELRRQRRL